MTNDYFALFLRQQLLLPLQSPAITAKSFVFTNYAVTRNYESHRICCAGSSDGTNCARFTQRFGNVAIRNCLPVRNRAQLLPNLTLKRSCPDVEWQIETRFVVVEMIQYLLHRLAQN